MSGKFLPEPLLNNSGKRKNDVLNLFDIEVASSAKKAKVDLDLEKEIFDRVDTERCDVEEEGRPISDKLAKRICIEWKKNSTKYNIRKHIYTRHLIPSNCSDITVPLMNSEIFKMASFTQYHKRVDEELQNIQKVMLKATAAVINLAEKAINSDKNSKLLDPKDVVMQSLDVCNLLRYCNTRLNSRRKAKRSVIQLLNQPSFYLVMTWGNW